MIYDQNNQPVEFVCSCGTKRVPIEFSASVAFICPKSRPWNFWKHTVAHVGLFNLFVPQFPKK